MKAGRREGLDSENCQVPSFLSSRLHVNSFGMPAVGCSRLPRPMRSALVSCALVAAVAIPGCSSKPATAIVLSIRSEVGAPTVDMLSFSVARGGQTRFGQDYGLPGDARLPGTLTFLADGDEGTARTYEARLTRGGRTVISRRARLAFVHERTKLLRLPLEVACADVICDAPDTTCIHGTCAGIDIDPSTLPEATAADASGAPAPGCYDEHACFNTATQQALSGCSFASIGDVTKVGVAVSGPDAIPHVLAPGVDYAIASGIVTLSPPVCAAVVKLGLAVLSSSSCPSLAAGQAICGTSAAGGAGGRGGASGASGGAGHGGNAGNGGVAGAPAKGGMSGASGVSGASGAAGVGGASGAGGKAGSAGGTAAGGASAGGGQGGSGGNSGLRAERPAPRAAQEKAVPRGRVARAGRRAQRVRQGPEARGPVVPRGRAALPVHRARESEAPVEPSCHPAWSTCLSRHHPSTSRRALRWSIHGSKCR